MLIGPFSSFHIDEIKQRLAEQNIPYALVQDPQALEKIRSEEKQRPPSRNPVFRSTGDYLYLDVDASSVDTILPHLEKYGVVAAATEEETERLENAEYHCPHCDYVSDNEGFCNKHNVRLLEFSDWVNSDSKSGKSGQMYAILFIITIIVGAALLRMYKVV
jgi:hypothetical protein